VTPLCPAVASAAKGLDNVSRHQIVKEVSAISALQWHNRMTTRSTECLHFEPKTQHFPF
jgi:hypothetical protein